MATDVNQQLADLAKRLKAAEGKAAEAEKARKVAEDRAERAEKARTKSFSMKIGAKGGVHMSGIKGAHSTYGLTLYPVTLQELYSRKDEIEGFIEKNRADLSWEKPVVVAE